MKTNIVINISPKIPCLVKIWFSGYESDCCWPIKLQDPLKCNISRKNLVMKYIFDMQINVESFFKLILSIWTSQTCPKYPKWEVSKSFQYLQRNITHELDFSHADKHKCFLQVDGITLGVRKSGMPKVPRIII